MGRGDENRKKGGKNGGKVGSYGRRVIHHNVRFLQFFNVPTFDHGVST